MLSIFALRQWQNCSKICTPVEIDLKSSFLPVSFSHGCTTLRIRHLHKENTAVGEAALANFYVTLGLNATGILSLTAESRVVGNQNRQVSLQGRAVMKKYVHTYGIDGIWLLVRFGPGVVAGMENRDPYSIPIACAKFRRVGRYALDLQILGHASTEFCFRCLTEVSKCHAFCRPGCWLLNNLNVWSQHRANMF